MSQTYVHKLKIRILHTDGIFLKIVIWHTLKHQDTVSTEKYWLLLL